MFHTAQRKLFIVDIENLLGTDRSRYGVRQVWEGLRPAVSTQDHIVVASGPTMARVALFELAGVPMSYHVRAGLNGADHELLDRIDELHAASRYDVMVIASGDHAFTSMALRATSAGMKVWQLAGRGGVSRQLRGATQLHAKLNIRRQGVPQELVLAA
ncbi:MAG: NYN domain-containing protein [Aeromicrobium sp.]|uniref:NYN domain-containing protein n=1 Tax=Aeromicrobium sp. TaxID=1871063 RepID=UPI0039E641F1